jgi:5-methylcytosine-specific restriction endonuclease McrA
MINTVHKTCAGWDDNTHPAFIWKRIKGKPYCKNCAMRLEPPKALSNKSNLKRTVIKKVSEKQKEKNKTKKEDTLLLHTIMYKWWESHGDFKTCENCGIGLPFEFSTANVHHLLSKAKYKNLASNPDNFMLLCMKCHNGWEISPNENKHKAIYDKTQIVKDKYE